MSLIAITNTLLRDVGQVDLNIMTKFGANASGAALSHQRVCFHVQSSGERFTKLAMHAHAGSDTPQVDNADDERMFRCARDEFDLDVSPKAGKGLSRYPSRCDRAWE